MDGSYRVPFVDTYAYHLPRETSLWGWHPVSSSGWIGMAFFMPRVVYGYEMKTVLLLSLEKVDYCCKRPHHVDCYMSALVIGYCRDRLLISKTSALA
jgi:hypothetical protein